MALLPLLGYRAVLFCGKSVEPFTTLHRLWLTPPHGQTGVMHLFYVVWDYTDERFFDKVNSSDCSQFTNLLGWPTSGE